MSDNGCLGETPLDEALSNPMWDDGFWDALELAERQAKINMMGLYDQAYEGYGCDCETCVVRTILESVWPTLTEQFTRLLIAKSEVRTLGTDEMPDTKKCCGTDGGCGRDRCQD